MQLARAMGFRVIAIDTKSEKQEMCLNTLGAEEFVDFAKGDVVANFKCVTGGLGAYAVILLALPRNLSNKPQEVNISWNYSALKKAI